MTTKDTFLSRIIHGLTDAFERAGEERARAYLLGLSNAHLSDMGLSRELIKQGPKAWPWHAEDQLAATGSHGAMRDIKPVGQVKTAHQRDDAETKLAA